MLMDIDEKDGSENRKSARIPDFFSLHYKLITEEEYKEKESFYIDRRTSHRPGSKRYEESSIAFDWSALENEIDYSPVVIKVLSLLNEKLDVILYRQEEILKCLKPTEKKETYETGECINLSGTGITMLIAEELKMNTLLELSIEPSVYPPLLIIALGKVKRVRPSTNKKKGGFEISINIGAINEDDRDELIKYIFKRQREMISSRKRSDDLYESML